MQEPTEYMAGLLQSDPDRYNVIAGIIYSDANNIQRMDISTSFESVTPETPEGRSVTINGNDYWVPKV